MTQQKVIGWTVAKYCILHIKISHGTHLLISVQSQGMYTVLLFVGYLHLVSIKLLQTVLSSCQILTGVSGAENNVSRQDQVFNESQVRSYVTMLMQLSCWAATFEVGDLKPV